jgi:hypothetical protein
MIQIILFLLMIFRENQKNKTEKNNLSKKLNKIYKFSLKKSILMIKLLYWTIKKLKNKFYFLWVLEFISLIIIDIIPICKISEKWVKII